MESSFSLKVFVVTAILLAYASASAYTIRSPSLSQFSLTFAEDSCAGRCNQTGTIPGAPCQCNKPCMRYGDCCSDYYDLCLPKNVTDKELEDLTEELINLDTVNNATAFITVDLQDLAAKNLLTVLPEAYSRNTISKLLKLHDNYNADVDVREQFTPEQEREIQDFIDAIFDTPLMKKAQEFLEAKELPSGKESFYTLWFQLYNRGGTTNSSSGFEHVFLADLPGNEVGGLHNWEFYAREEDANRMEFFKKIVYLDFGPKGSVIEHSFNWRNINKPVSSMWIGTSPEFELALYTVCWHARVDKLCPVSIDGTKFKIQTFTLTSSRGCTLARLTLISLPNYSLILKY